MSVILNDRADLVVPAARVLRTAIDTGDGGTDEQRRLDNLFLGDQRSRLDRNFRRRSVTVA